MRKTIAAVALALALTGCADSPEPAKEPVSGSNATVEKAPKDKKEKKKDDGIYEFGEQVVYDDGLALTVSKPKPYKRGRWAAGGEKFDSHVKFQITVVNGTDKPYDPSQIYATVQSGNIEGDEIFESPKLDGAPMTQVLPGRETTFPVGYGVKNPDDIVMEISIDYAKNPVLYVWEGKGQAKSNSQANSQANSQVKNAPIMTEDGLREALGLDALNYINVKGEKCEASVLLTDAGQVSLYADAGDFVVTNYEGNLGVKMGNDDPKCVRYFAQTLGPLN